MSDLSKDLFNLLVSKNFTVRTLDNTGKSVINPEQAEIFSFDVQFNNNNYGAVVILLDDESNFELFFGDKVGKSMEVDDKDLWYDLLHQLRMFAKRNLLSFNLKNLNKLKYTMQGMAALKEGLFEGMWSGTSKTSYNNPSKKTRIVARHNKRLGEDDARFRNIKTLFVENEDGERFRLPFTNIGGARAMARHVSEGGNPYDTFGVHITETVKNIGTLGGFLRIRSLNEQEQVHGILETCRSQYKTMRKDLKSMAGKRGYKKYLEVWEPSQIDEDEALLDSIRNVFAEGSVSEKVENALPLIARLHQNVTEDNVIQHKFGTKQAQKGKTPYHHDPELEANIPKWDPINQRNVPAGVDYPEGYINMAEVEPYDHFEVKYHSKNSASIMGVTKDGHVVQTSTTTASLADALVDAYNRGGFTVKDIQRVSMTSKYPKVKSERGKPDLKLVDNINENKNMKELLEFEDWVGKITEGDVIQGPWTNKRVVNPPASNVEKLMPKWDSNTQRVATSDSEMSAEVEDFKHFEVIYFDKNPNVSARIVGITADNRRVAIGNISREKAEMYVNRFNHHLKNKNITEGTWAIPKTNTQLEQLRQVLSKPIPASEAETIMYHIIGDDDLFDELLRLNDMDPTTDARPIIIEWIKENNGKFKGMVDLSTAIDEPTNELSKTLKQIGLGEEISNTPFSIEQLAKKFKEPIPVGVDAMNATEILYNIIDDDDLFNQLSELANEDPEADARSIIISWLFENGHGYVADSLDYDSDVIGGDKVDSFIDDVEADGTGMQEDFDNDPSLGDWITSPWDSFNKKADNNTERWNADMKRLRSIAGDSYEAHRAEQGCLGDPVDCLTDFNKKRANKSKSLGEDAEMNNMLRLAGLNKSQTDHSLGQ